MSFTIILILLSIWLCFNISFCSRKSSYATFEYDKDNLVKVKTTSNDVEIKRGTSSNLVIKTDSKEITLSPGKDSKIKSDGKLITIELPDYECSLDVKTVSGNITSREIVVDELKVNSVSGMIKLDNTLSSQARVESVSGDINYSSLSTGALEANSVSGRINLKTHSKNVKVNSVSGSITLSLPSYDYAYEYKMLSGSIDLSKLTNNSSYGYLNAQTVSGSVTVY